MTLAVVDTFVCDQAEADNELRRNDTAEVVNRQYTIVLVDKVDGRVIAQGQSLNELRAQVLDDDGNVIFASVSALSEVQATAEEAIARWTLSVIGSDADGNNVYGQIIAGADGEAADLILAFDRIALGRVNGSKVYPFVLNAAGEIIIDTALIDNLTIGKLVDSDGTLVVDDGKIKAEYIDVDNLQVNYSLIVGSKPPADADKTSNNTAAGFAGQGALATRDTVTWNGMVVGAGRPADNADVTGDNTAADTNKVAGTAASTIRDRANAGNSAKSRVDSWTRTGTTLIDGGSLYTDDAFIVNAMIKNASVDTLNIRGQAVTQPSLTVSNTTYNLSDGSWTQVCSKSRSSSQIKGGDAQVTITGIYNAAANGGAIVEVRLERNGSTIFEGMVVDSTNNNGGASGSYSIPVLDNGLNPNSSATYTLHVRIRTFGSSSARQHIYQSIGFVGLWR